MKFQQALLLLEATKEELFDNHKVLGFRSLGDAIELHVGSKELFESIEGEAILATTTSCGEFDEDYLYDHYKKRSGNVVYIYLYKRKKPTPVKEQAGDQGEGGASD